MAINKKHWNRPYSKRLYDKIQGAVDKVNADNERFEDVPQELDELDRAGSVKITSYYEYYRHLIFYPDKNDTVQPAGMTANNSNYN